MIKFFVKNYDQSSNKIKDYDILRMYGVEDIKKLKKKAPNKQEFSNSLRMQLQYHYWSRAEYELIIRKTPEGRIVLSPWCGCSNPAEAEIDVTDDVSLDWKGFFEYHVSRQICKNEAKIDIFDQLTYKDRFEKLVDELWYNHFPYERDHPKFHEEKIEC